MPGVEHDEVAGPACECVAEVVESAAAHPIAVGATATARAGPATVVSAPEADVRLGRIDDASDAFGGVGSVLAWPWHGEAPGRGDLPGNTPARGSSFTNPARFPCYRVKKRPEYP